MAIHDAETMGWKLETICNDSRAVLKRPVYGSTEAHILLGVFTFWTLGLVNAGYAYLQYKLRSPVWMIRVDPTEQYTGSSAKLEKLRTEVENRQADGWLLEKQIGDSRATMVKQRYGKKRVHLTIFVLTFWSWGLGNGVYALYRRHATREKRVVRVD